MAARLNAAHVHLRVSPATAVKRRAVVGRPSNLKSTMRIVPNTVAVAMTCRASTTANAPLVVLIQVARPDEATATRRSFTSIRGYCLRLDCLGLFHLAWISTDPN